MGQIPLRVIQDHPGKKPGGPGAINPISSISFLILDPLFVIKGDLDLDSRIKNEIFKSKS